MNIVNDILVNTLFPDTDFIQTLDMNSVVPKYVENQEKGNPSVCKNCAEAPFRDLHIYGRSEQMTTTGAQLIDINSFQKNNDISVKIVNNYSIELKSTIKKDASDSNKAYLNVLIYADILIGKTITMSYDEWNSNVPNEISIFGVRYNLNGKTIYENINSKSKIKTVTIPLDATDCRVRLFLTEGVAATVKAGTYTAIIKGIMICEGTVAKSWEPYTGGKPSPSPDYPQEIVSAGDDGNLNVMVRGKNIFPGPEQPKTVERNGLTFFYKDGMYTLTGTSNENTWFNIYPVIDKTTSTSPTHNGNTICSDGKIAVVNGLKNKLCNIAFRNADDKNRTTIITASNNKKLLQHNTSGVFIFAPPGSYSDTFTLMITGENQTEDYEPYHTTQTLTLSTPNGLPGIPVTSGGNYTDENGQQWICDEVDLGRGVYVQRVDKGAFDATKALTEQSVILATPIETPLTAAEIAAYKSLRTYRGTTIVEAEDKAGISVKYNMPMPKLSKNGALRRWFKRHPII